MIAFLGSTQRMPVGLGGGTNIAVSSPVGWSELPAGRPIMLLPAMTCGTAELQYQQNGRTKFSDEAKRVSVLARHWNMPHLPRPVTMACPSIRW